MLAAWPDQGGDAAQLDRPAADPGAEAQAIAKAAFRAAAVLVINMATLAKILGLSKVGSARLVEGTFELAPLVRATLFVRVFAALDALMSGDEQAARAWLRARTFALRDRPLAVMQAPSGLVKLS